MTIPPVFGYPSVLNDFVISAGSGSSWQDTFFPLSNILTDDLKQVARTFDESNPHAVIQGVAAADVQVGMMALLGTNISPRRRNAGTLNTGTGLISDSLATAAGTVRLRLYSDAAMSTVILDTTALSAWPGDPVYLRITDGGPKFRNHDWFWCDGNNYTIRAFRLDINDVGQLTNHLDFGRLEVATMLEVPYDFLFGATLSRKFRTTFTETPAGQEVYNQSVAPLTFAGSFFIEDEDILEEFLTMMEENDLDVPFLFILDPNDNTTWAGKNAMFCRFVTPDFYYSVAAPDRVEIPIQLEQVL